MTPVAAHFDAIECLLLISKAVARWQDANRQLVRRWDNVKHHLELPNAPHHVHRAGGQVEGVQPPPDLETVLKEIEGYLGINS